MQKLVLVVLTILAMFLGACGGPGIGDGTQGPDGNKKVVTGAKQFPVVYKDGGDTPLLLMSRYLLSQRVTINAGEQKSVILTEPKAEFKLSFGAALAGYIHPKELRGTEAFLTVKAGGTITLSGQAIPWLFPRRFFGSLGVMNGTLIPVTSLDQVKWDDDGELQTDFKELTISVYQEDTSTIFITDESSTVLEKFRWTGKGYRPVTSNLIKVSIRYLLGSQVPRHFTDLFAKNKPQNVRSLYRDVASNATWEVTLVMKDKQGKEVTKKYYALVAKPY